MDQQEIDELTKKMTPELYEILGMEFATQKLRAALAEGIESPDKIFDHLTTQGHVVTTAKLNSGLTVQMRTPTAAQEEHALRRSLREPDERFQRSVSIRIQLAGCLLDVNGTPYQRPAVPQRLNRDKEVTALWDGQIDQALEKLDALPAALVDHLIIAFNLYRALIADIISGITDVNEVIKKSTGSPSTEPSAT